MVRYLSGTRVLVHGVIDLRVVADATEAIIRRQLALVPVFAAASAEDRERLVRHVSGNLAQAWPTLMEG